MEDYMEVCLDVCSGSNRWDISKEGTDHFEHF